VGGEDVDALRAQGWNDPAIHDAIQVVSYFNYINRVADGVGVDDEPDWTSLKRPVDTPDSRPTT
jgi:hypothetical protein